MPEVIVSYLSCLQETYSQKGIVKRIYVDLLGECICALPHLFSEEVFSDFCQIFLNDTDSLVRKRGIEQVVRIGHYRSWNSFKNDEVFSLIIKNFKSRICDKVKTVRFTALKGLFYILLQNPHCEDFSLSKVKVREGKAKSAWDGMLFVEQKLEEEFEEFKDTVIETSKNSYLRLKNENRLNFINKNFYTLKGIKLIGDKIVKDDLSFIDLSNVECEEILKLVPEDEIMNVGVRYMLQNEKNDVKEYFERIIKSRKFLDYFYESILPSVYSILEMISYQDKPEEDSVLLIQQSLIGELEAENSEILTTIELDFYDLVKSIHVSTPDCVYECVSEIFINNILNNSKRNKLFLSIMRSEKLNDKTILSLQKLFCYVLKNKKDEDFEDIVNLLLKILIKFNEEVARLSSLRGLLVFSDLYSAAIRLHMIDVFSPLLKKLCDVKNNIESISLFFRIFLVIFQKTQVPHFLIQFVEANQNDLIKYVRKETIDIIGIFPNSQKQLYSILHEMGSSITQVSEQKEVDDLNNFIGSIGDVLLKCCSKWKLYANNENSSQDGEGDEYMDGDNLKHRKDEFINNYINFLVKEKDGLFSKYLTFIVNIITTRGIPDKTLSVSIVSLGKYMLISKEIAIQHISSIMNLFHQSSNDLIKSNCLVVLSDMISFIPNDIDIEKVKHTLFDSLKVDRHTNVRKTAVCLLGNMFVNKMIMNNALYNMSFYILDKNKEIKNYVQSVFQRIFKSEIETVPRIVYNIVLFVSRNNNDNNSSDEYMSILLSLLPSNIDKKKIEILFIKSFCDNPSINISRCFRFFIPSDKGVKILCDFLERNSMKRFFRKLDKDLNEDSECVYENLVSYLKKVKGNGKELTPLKSKLKVAFESSQNNYIINKNVKNGLLSDEKLISKYKSIISKNVESPKTKRTYTDSSDSSDDDDDEMDVD